MLETVLNGIFGFIIDYFISLFWWFLFFPVVWLVSLPFISIIAIFRREAYGCAVGNMLYSVHSTWRDWGIGFAP